MRIPGVSMILKVSSHWGKVIAKEKNKALTWEVPNAWCRCAPLTLQPASPDVTQDSGLFMGSQQEGNTSTKQYIPWLEPPRAQAPRVESSHRASLTVVGPLYPNTLSRGNKHTGRGGVVISSIKYSTHLDIRSLLSHLIGWLTLVSIWIARSLKMTMGRGLGFAWVQTLIHTVKPIFFNSQWLVFVFSFRNFLPLSVRLKIIVWKRDLNLGDVRRVCLFLWHSLQILQAQNISQLSRQTVESIYGSNFFVTDRKRSWGKVMFFTCMLFCPLMGGFVCRYFLSSPMFLPGVGVWPPGTDI